MCQSSTTIMLLIVSLRATSSLTRGGVAHVFTRHQHQLQAVATRQYGSATWYEPSLMDHMLYRIKECNQVPDNIEQSLLDFSVDGKILGKVTPQIASRLCDISSPSKQSIFQLDQSTASANGVLTLSEAAGATPESRTDAVSSVMNQLRDSGFIKGWRNEMFPVAECFDEVSNPVFLVERAAAPLLGVLEYGVHINGIVKGEGDDIKMWMARRSRTKSKFPGFVDHIVAGGQPAGLSLIENVIKECQEEAGIPSELTLKGVKPAGAISYTNYSKNDGAMNRVVLFNFDLEIPHDFVPHANDGEVESFFKWTLDDIAASMDPKCKDPIKPNCYLVIIDWLMRTGSISPDSPKYLDVLRTLRSGTCM